MVLCLQKLEEIPVSSQQIAKATRTDPLLSKVYDFVLSGWPENVEDLDLQKYFNKRNELSVHQGCLL